MLGNIRGKHVEALFLHEIEKVQFSEIRAEQWFQKGMGRRDFLSP